MNDYSKKFAIITILAVYQECPYLVILGTRYKENICME